jgi:hypothetical protein
MSALFGSTKYIAPDDPKPFGARTERIDTNEGARILPWFAGTRWMGVTWMGDAFKVKTAKITRKVGKKKTTVGYRYYASFCGLVCNGPVDRIVRIRFDDEIVWTGPVNRNDENFVSITIPSRGVLHCHWGTESQTIHSILANSGQEHSAYRGQFYIIGDNMFFGNDKTNAPNIQIELGRWPRPSWLTLAQSKISDLDANPIAVLWDWWQDARFGLNRPESDLDTARLTTAGIQVASELLGVSPLLTTELEAKSALVKLLEYFDGFPTSYNGKFGVELVRPVTGTIPALTSADMLDDPNISGQTWTDTFDETRVKFIDQALEGADNSAKHHELANFFMTGRHRTQNFDRPWIIRADMAAQVAGVLGRIGGLPQFTGNLRLRESSARSILVGSVFDLQTRDGETMRMRVQERTEPQPDRRQVDIGFDSDKGWANTDFSVASADVVPEATTMGPEPPYAVRILDAPYAFADPDLATLVYMVARGDTYSTGYDAWKATAAEGDYVSAGEHRSGNLFENFGVRAKLTSEYSAATLPIDDVVGIAFEVLSPDQTLLEDEWDINDALDHKLLAFFTSTATEIMSLFNVVKTGDTTYTADVVRGLYDTRRRTHPVNTEIWLQLRTLIEHDAWPPLSEDARWYKFQPVFGTGEVDLSDLAAEAHTENARSLRALAPLNVAVDGDSSHAQWTAGNNITVTWNNTSRKRTLFGLAFSEAPVTDLESVLFELRSYDGVTLVDDFEVTPSSQSTVVTNAYLVANGNSDFRLRAYGLRSGRRSLDYTDVLVRKI